MNTFAVAILSIGLSVAAQFSLKAGMSGTEVRELISQPLSVHGAFAVLTDVFVITGFTASAPSRGLRFCRSGT
jgi:hypothetical protein